MSAVWVHSAGKAGRDAGELVGIGPIGIATTTDIEAVLASEPECVVYTASGPEMDAVNVPIYEALLRAGVNVVTVSSPDLVYPPAWDDQMTAALGIVLDEIRETYKRRATPRDLHVAAGFIPAGSCGAIRMETIGVVDGRDAAAERSPARHRRAAGPGLLAAAAVDPAEACVGGAAQRLTLPPCVRFK